MDKVYVVLLTFDNNEMYEDRIYYTNYYQGVFSSVEKATEYILSCYEKSKSSKAGRVAPPKHPLCTSYEEGDDILKRYHYKKIDSWGDVEDYYYDIKEVVIDDHVSV